MRKIVNINRGWVFSKTAEKPPINVNDDWEHIDLPHTWNAVDGQDGGNDYHRGTCWYVRRLDRRDLPEADRYYLEICGANASAAVWINGRHMAEHDGGYSTWRVDITDALEDENTIALSVDNSENDRVYPQMADFTFYGGLYRDVNIIAVNRSHFNLDYYGGPGIMVTPVVQDKNAAVTVEVFVTDSEPMQRILYTLRDMEGNVVDKRETDTKVVFEIPNAHLWHGIRDPYLYSMSAELISDGRVIDNVSTRFGCRSFRIDPEEGFILNGESYPLRGASRHQDRWGIGNALLRKHHDEDIQLICEAGFNSVRLAHYQHDRYFYDLCDEYGLVVWAEIPYISRHMPGGRENTISQMKELVVQNYNHPSIVVWGLSNEITISGSTPDLIENHRLLNDICHELDSTRKTVIACVSPCDIRDPYLNIPDAVAYNHYFGWYGGDTSMNGPWFDRFHAERPDIAIGCSEYGCEGLDWHTSNPVQGDYTEEYQAYYHEELIRQLFSRQYLWATYVWNMFDFGADARNEGGENGQNHKGLITFDRSYKKDAFYAYKAWLSDEPFVHLCGKRYVDRVEDVAQVTVYSNMPEVELFANGVSIGKKRAEDHFFRFEVPNRGDTKLVAEAGTLRDEGYIRKVDVFNENYRLKDTGAVLNWFDVTEKEGFLSLNDKVSDILATEGGRQIFGEIMKRIGNGGMAAGFEVSEAMMEMMGGFTMLRLTGLLPAMGIKLGREELLDMNKALNNIAKE